MGTSHPHLLQSPQKLIKDQADETEPGLGLGLPRQHSWKASACQCSTRRRMFDPRVWRERWCPLHVPAWSVPWAEELGGPGHGGGKESDTPATERQQQQVCVRRNQLTILRLSFLNLQTWLNDGDLRKLVTTNGTCTWSRQWGRAQSFYSTNEKCLLAHGDACPLVSWQEEAGAAAAHPAAGW